MHLDTTTPTFVSNRLIGLCTQLGVELGLSVSPVDLPDGVNEGVEITPLRILDFYQATGSLGLGSFGMSI